ncbi:hypothetical protein Tco_0996839 [Tanacetum coccineum]
MGRDTIQLETAVSTISPEYLLEFTSEYGIAEELHPKLPSPGDRIVDFPEGKDEMSVAGSYPMEDVVALNTRRTPIQKQPEALLCLVGLSRRYFLGDDVYPTFLYDDDREMDLFNLISAPNPTKVKTGTRPRAAHEVPLLIATATRVIAMEDAIGLSSSSGTPSTMEKSPLDFSNEDSPRRITESDETENQGQETVAPEVPPQENVPTMGVTPEISLEKEVAAMGPLVSKKRRERGGDGADANAPPKVLRKDHAAFHPTQSTIGEKSTRLDTGPCRTRSRSQSLNGILPSKSSKGATVTGDPDSEKSTSFTSFTGSPNGIYQPGWGVTNSCRLESPDVCQDVVDHIVPPGYFSELRHLRNEDFLNQYNMNLARQVAMGSQLRLRFEQEVRLLKRATKKVAKRDQRIQAREEEIKKLDQEIHSLKSADTEVQGLRNQTKNLKALLRMLISRGEERIKAAFEEFKRYEDDKVEQRCVEMDARLDKLSIDFDEELYPHMLTAIAGHRWLIGHGLRLAVLKCAKSLEIRQAFANVVSAGLAKGMSEGLHYGIKHGKADRDLWGCCGRMNLIANDSYVTALQRPKYPVVGPTREWIHDLRPSSSQLKIPIYPEVCDPKDPWAVKEEISLEDAIAANVSQTEKKKKCRVVYRTHGVGSAHHARSDGCAVISSDLAPQGLAIFLMEPPQQNRGILKKRGREFLRRLIRCQVFTYYVYSGVAIVPPCEHGKVGRDLGDVEAYDLEANDKFVKALQDLKDLKYPIVDQLERLKDSPIDLIMAFLHLESDTGEDAPQWIHDLRPSSSKLKIPIYPEVCDPKDPWVVKEEISLEDAIATNISRTEKKKKCRVVCRTYDVGSAHHARSDGVVVSVPTAAP